MVAVTMRTTVQQGAVARQEEGIRIVAGGRAYSNCASSGNGTRLICPPGQQGDSGVVDGGRGTTAHERFVARDGHLSSGTQGPQHREYPPVVVVGGGEP
jgi:hypothetical protein